MPLHALEDLFLEQLQDLLDAEYRLVDTLPKLAKAAKNPELKMAFREHLKITKGQAKRLEKIFKTLQEKAERKPCKGMKGLIEEGSEFLKGKKMDPSVRDAGLIAAAQRVEHYEIAGYGSARTFAEQLGFQEAAQMLQETLDEEKEADVLLTKIAEGSVNAEAMA